MAETQHGCIRAAVILMPGFVADGVANKIAVGL